ncbi:HAMP domain-containing sensor histidine kinase [Romboutsia sp. 1001216sp1]|uniref:HAMP domain-containing sensor histidine kinase n=1 Tax=Romboutsia sp. 1001216sp1 TaxID=2986997 RepID=UPI00232F24F0|nr:sensor histidine kinase [Romboutsia sp. 1001216sp1]MDB8803523.1 sensor histidine kinase [Romboutsia sp. 1001216sp1]MDB8808463.1 sensor histidine kinase [Romboutsia sp. 1001216sp1]MDB8809171.1 sensor histidine kinase [Romboutsia sp. 1001216sp1]MDB8814919.1 sensor histidine kinase [Romboutsia sp. 1001216sp1]MDB8819652.1 sensor histidine kinase [Romboutsia sp. 1001216sp1]
MDIKLKTLNKSINIEDSKLKVASLLILFLSMSICFESLFNLAFSFHNIYEYSPIARYIFFGNVIHLDNRSILSIEVIVFIISLAISIGCIVVYNITKKSNIKIFDSFINLTSNVSIEVFLFIIGFIFFIRFHTWSSAPDFFDNSLIVCDFLILTTTYIAYKSFKLSSNNLLSRLIVLSMIKDFLDKQNKKTINNKIASILVISIIIQFIIMFIFLSVISYFSIFAMIYAMLFSLFSIIPYSYIYKLLTKKTKYIEYISKNIKTIENGDLSHKLKVIGNDEISSIASSINNISLGLEKSLNEQLKSEKMKTELITNVSHDLKTPLTSIVSYIDILKNNELDSKTTKDYINILDKKATRLKDLVEDIFEASKISSGDIEINLKKTDIKELLIQSIVELEDKIESSKLDFIIDTPDYPVFTNIDGKRMFRVFENLITNITKYSLANTRVYIDINVKDDYIFITMKNISNHRLNISSDELLERFVRGDVSRNTSGNGLGLSICSNLVDLQDGSLKLDIDGDLFKVILKFKVY